MKNYLNAFLLFLVLPFLSFSQTTKKVLIIGIDGCRSDALTIANTPNTDQLIANGIYSPHALNDDITISGPGWSSIICGVRSDKHLVTNNNFDGNDYATYPPFIKYVEEFDSELHTVSICHWAPINDNIMDNTPDFKLNVSSDAEVANQAIAYLNVNDPDVMFLHFDDVDHVGHADGFDPEVVSYLSAIEEVDVFVGNIVSAIEQRPNYSEEDWLILLTTDHGGLGTSHGGNSIEERMVFVIASGNSIASDLIVRDSTITTDSPNNCLDESIELRFDGTNDHVQIPANSLFDFGANQDFTIECRVRTNNASDVAIIGNKDWDSGVNKGFIFSFKLPSGPEWKVNIGDGANRVDLNTGGSIADNEWHTLSVSFDRDGLMKMYEDGNLLDQADISNIGDITTNQGLFFGTDFNQAYDYNGAIAEVRVWNRVVEAQEISNWYCEMLNNSHPNFGDLSGYWKLNETTGNIANDFSSNNNNGQIINAQWLTPGTVVSYDYEETPRLVDVPITALTHLCIPIQNAWNMDGTSLIPICTPTNIEDKRGGSIFEISPNPAKNNILFNTDWNNISKKGNLICYNITGQKVIEQSITINEASVNISKLVPGTYYTFISIGEQRFVNRFVVY